MAIENHLTAIDYLGMRKFTVDWDREGQSLKRMELSRYQGFSSMFQSCLEGKNSTGLSALDYLKNPVMSKPFRLKISASSSLEAESCDTKYFVKNPIKQKSVIEVQTQERKSTEKPPDVSVMEKIEQSISKAAEKYGLSRDLIRGIIQAESGFQVTAVSSAGAQGLMQLMPMTAQEMGVKDSFDIDQNIDGGARYLRKMLDRFGNDIGKALAAYNAGPGTVERYEGEVPYQETRQYVARVINYAGLTA